MHVYLFDRRDRRQFDETKELTVTAELPEKGIEPIDLEATRAGPGHYVVSGAAFGVKGEWTVEIASRVSEFDEFRTKLHVPVR
jgi:copper transport protein